MSFKRIFSSVIHLIFLGLTLLLVGDRDALNKEKSHDNPSVDFQKLNDYMLFSQICFDEHAILREVFIYLNGYGAPAQISSAAKNYSKEEW
ncbi:MAG: hypothetical protein WAO12_09390 [Venatoribacter sp.]